MRFSPYLNFDGNAREAFSFYHKIFGGELQSMPMTDAPDMPPLSEEEKNRCLHVSLTLPNGLLLMASDTIPSLGQKLRLGNNNYICVSTDSRAQADEFFQGLSENAEIEMPMADMFWGDYFGSLIDQFGICWMISYNENFQ